MGWLFKASLGPHSTPKAHLDALYTWSNEEADCRLLKSAVRGRVYYAAVERVFKVDGRRSVCAAVCLFRYSPKSRDGHVFGYKDMDENMGPRERNCPAGILDLLTATTREYAVQWRADCRANLAHQLTETRKPRPKDGDIVVLGKPAAFIDGALLSRFKATRLPRRRNLVFQSLENGRFYRLPRLTTLDYRLNPPQEEGRTEAGGFQTEEKAMSNLAPAVETSIVTVVPEERRLDFLPKLFSDRWLIRGENAVYDFMGALSPDYSGGLWQFYELAGQPLYMAPDRDDRMQITWHGNGYEGEVSADAAGIIACLFTFSNLSLRFGSEFLGEAYHRLRDYAGGHPEAAAIFAAID